MHLRMFFLQVLRQMCEDIAIHRQRSHGFQGGCKLFSAFRQLLQGFLVRGLWLQGCNSLTGGICQVKHLHGTHHGSGLGDTFLRQLQKPRQLVVQALHMFRADAQRQEVAVLLFLLCGILFCIHLCLCCHGFLHDPRRRHLQRRLHVLRAPQLAEGPGQTAAPAQLLLLPLLRRQCLHCRRRRRRRHRRRHRRLYRRFCALRDCGWILLHGRVRCVG
mmetsp:Transcript_39170/g.61658  ORF Transcript_39170/g.61658 Transcript_39170/m.61658 type:complete len:217 (-) Transcript_39170:235-885(-)